MGELSLESSAVRHPAKRPSILPAAVEKLNFKVGDQHIICEMNFVIGASGCTAIMGYNGAGKSVLIRLLHGLITPTSGTVKWTGATNQKDIARHQAMVFQAPVLLRRSVEANVAYALRMRGFTGVARRERLEEILLETELLGMRGRIANVLSGGERQRVALARALAVEPEIVFLDEPTASLDPAATMAIEKILSKSIAAGCKIVLVTQSIGQAQRLSNDVLFVHRGRLAEHTPIEQFLAQPSSAAARAFIGGQLYDK